MNNYVSPGARSRPQWMIANLLVAVSLVLGAAGCGGTATSTSVPARTVPPSPRPPQPTAAPTSAGATTDDVLTLTWWAPEFVSPQASQPVGPLLAEQLNAFSASQDGKVRVEVEQKARYGKGGLLDFLLSAQPVAPTVLPDVVLLDVADLEKAVEADILQPLNPLLDETLAQNLYGFAREAGEFGGQRYAVQFLSDFDHAVYLPSQVDQPPAQLSDILARQTTYLLPLGLPSGGASGGASGGLSRAVLSQYISAGATFGADRRLVAEAQPLLRLLTFYENGVQAGLIPPNALELGDGEAVWGVFSQGKVPLASASARRFLTGGETLDAGFAPAPGFAGPATPSAGGWALAVVTTDPERQAAAADLIAWLLKPENASAWATALGWLPTSPDAVRMLNDSPYRDFLDSQLTSARGLPAGSDYPDTAARIHAAIVSVVEEGSDAITATNTAINGEP